MVIKLIILLKKTLNLMGVTPYQFLITEIILRFSGVIKLLDSFGGYFSGFLWV